MKNGIIAIFCAILLSLGAAMTASAGSVVDTDGDAVPDLFDNCRDGTINGIPSANGPFAAFGSCGTAVQLDSDGDGFGNPCDGDLNQDLAVNGNDFTAMFPLLFAGPGPGDFNCNGVTDGNDFTALFGLLFKGLGPGAL